MAYVSMADPDSAKWEQDLKAGIASGPTKTKQTTSGRTITVHTGPFRLASFHKAFDGWFQQEGLLGLFADDGKLLNGKTYGTLKNYDKKKYPAIKYALMLWGDQFSKSGPDHAIDESGMRLSPRDVSAESEKLLKGVVGRLVSLPELRSLAADLDLGGGEADTIVWGVRGGVVIGVCAALPHLADSYDTDSRLFVKAVWTDAGGAEINYDGMLAGVWGVKLTVGCLGEQFDGKPVVAWKSARPLSDAAAIEADLNAAAKDFEASAKSLLAQARKAKSGNIGLIGAFKENMRTYLAKAKELPDLKDIRWIAVMSYGEVRLLGRPKQKGRPIDGALAAYRIDHPANSAWTDSDGRKYYAGKAPKASITAERLDPDFKLIAARGDERHWTEYGHLHRYNWTDYAAQGASEAALKALGIDTKPWKKPFGAGTDDNDVESGSFKGGFAVKSYRSGECDTGD